MDYTSSPDSVVDSHAGKRRHDDTGAVPTVWSAKDANSIIWSMMEVLNAAGVDGRSFDPTDPDSYQRFRAAIQKLTLNLLTVTLADPDLGDGLVSVLQPFAGAVLRTQHAKNADVISAKDAGAKGDGVADDTGAVLAAYKASDVVYFPPGTYRTSIARTLRYAGPGVPVDLDGKPAKNFINKAGRKKRVILIIGQSNAAGANSGGPNPGNPLVRTWDGLTSTWGSSDYTKAPWTHASPHGNSGHNNIGLGLAHRFVDENGDEPFIVYDAVSGRPIGDWTADGEASVRFASLCAKTRAALASPELAGAGKSTVDVIIWAQGEEDDLTDDVAAYKAKFATLERQLRAQPWCESSTPILVMGMSSLHQRYQVGEAQRSYCESVSRACVYVNSAGLQTSIDVHPGDPDADATHWWGTSLWEAGYVRCWEALRGKGVSHRYGRTPFYARGTGPWDGENVAVAMFDCLISRNSTTNDFPINAPASVGSIGWGYQCNPDGNYTLAGGYQTTIDNLCSYSAGWGRALVFGAGAAYSGAFGFQNTLSAQYGFSAGRGHGVSDRGGAAVGTFSHYTEAQSDAVMFQVGIGTSASVAKNGLTVRQSGAVEINVGSSADPAQKQEIVFEYGGNTRLIVKMRGTDGAVRSAVLELT